jgi:hypothetical protein
MMSISHSVIEVKDCAVNRKEGEAIDNGSTSGKAGAQAERLGQERPTKAMMVEGLVRL